MTQTKLRTYEINSNKNITFPIGTAVSVQKYSEKLDFEKIFGKYKKKGRELNALIEALITYRLSENQSIRKFGRNEV